MYKLCEWGDVELYQYGITNICYLVIVLRWSAVMVKWRNACLQQQIYMLVPVIGSVVCKL